MADAPAIFGLVLAGGRSRRFGRDKAAVRIHGRALLERSVNLLQTVTQEVYVSVRADQKDDRLRSQFALIIDQDEGFGPAAGILAAHRARPDAAWLILACDLPLIDEEAISRLLQSRNPQRAATAYRRNAEGLPEPLCAIYEPDTLARFARQAGAGADLSPTNCLVRVDVELIEPAGEWVLSNVNTPDELSRLNVKSDSK